MVKPPLKLFGIVKPGILQHIGAKLLGDFTGFVGRERVHNDDPLRHGLHTSDAALDVQFLIVGEDDDGEGRDIQGFFDNFF